MLRNILPWAYRMYGYCTNGKTYLEIIKTYLRKDKRDIYEKYQSYTDRVREYIECKKRESEVGGFSDTYKNNTIYAMTYSALLMLDLGMEPSDEVIQNIWEQIDNAQCSDGLFYDPNLLNYQFIIGDGFGARHLLPHVIILYAKLGKIPKYNFEYLDFLINPQYALEFMKSLDWTNPWGTSNVVMNYVVAMQYARDFMNNSQYNDSITAIENWLIDNINPQVGMWTSKTKLSKTDKYEAVRGAYHIYPLLKYDKLEIPYAERAIDTILNLQNRVGGYDFKYNSGACEDIDAIDALIRLSMQTDYKRDLVKGSIVKSIDWVLQNQMSDGGFVFSLGEKFRYGNSRLRSGKNESNLFGTWFRNLSLMYMFDYLEVKDMGFQRIPGMELDYK